MKYSPGLGLIAKKRGLLLIKSEVTNSHNDGINAPRAVDWRQLTVGCVLQGRHQGLLVGGTLQEWPLAFPSRAEPWNSKLQHQPRSKAVKSRLHFRW